MTHDLALHDPLTYKDGFPHEYFRHLRDTAPVSHHDHPQWDRGFWAVVRHADVQRVSRDSHTFRNAPHPFLEAGPDEDNAGISELLISKDQPEHTKLRKLISSGFTPRRVSDLADRLRDRVDRLISALHGRSECDLVTDLALWLPLHVIADLVGVPEADRKQIFEWTEITFGFDPVWTQDERQEAAMQRFPLTGPSSTLCWASTRSGFTPGSGFVALPGFIGVAPGNGEIKIPPVSVCHHVSTIGRRSSPSRWTGCAATRHCCRRRSKSCSVGSAR